MHLEILVEEPSAEAALLNLLPKILPADVSFVLHPFQGKRDLLRKLPGRLRGYSRWVPSDWAIVVLMDADNRDCRDQKRDLYRIAAAAGFSTRPGAGRLRCLNRLAIEELEAWFFGDVEALRAAYPGVPSSLASQSWNRDPDAIRGGTWEALERVLQRAGYHLGGLSKTEAARAITEQMLPERNRSGSFRAFCQGLRSLIER